MYICRWLFERAGLQKFVGLIDAKPLEYKPSALCVHSCRSPLKSIPSLLRPPARKRLNNARTNPFSSFPDADLC